MHDLSALTRILHIVCIIALGLRSAWLSCSMIPSAGLLSLAVAVALSSLSLPLALFPCSSLSLSRLLPLPRPPPFLSMTSHPFIWRPRAAYLLSCPPPCLHALASVYLTLLQNWKFSSSFHDMFSTDALVAGAERTIFLNLRCCHGTV